MNRTEFELEPGFIWLEKSTITGQRTKHIVTLEGHTEITLGEDLFVKIPKLDDYSCLVPGSFHLLFDLSTSNTKTHFLNNLSKLLQSKLKITLAGKNLYENDAESVYSIYKDLYKSKSQRRNMIQYEIGSTNLRKLISKDDTGATSGNTTKVSEKLMYNIYGTKQKICLDKIIGNHGLYAPYHMIHNFIYHIKFPKSEEILVAQSGQTRGDYKLENVKMEYETINNVDIARNISDIYSVGLSLSYECVKLDKEDT